MTTGDYDPQVQEMAETLTQNGFPTLARYFADEMDPSQAGGASSGTDVATRIIEDLITSGTREVLDELASYVSGIVRDNH